MIKGTSGLNKQDLSSHLSGQLFFE